MQFSFIHSLFESSFNLQGSWSFVTWLLKLHLPGSFVFQEEDFLRAFWQQIGFWVVFSPHLYIYVSNSFCFQVILPAGLELPAPQQKERVSYWAYIWTQTLPWNAQYLLDFIVTLTAALSDTSLWWYIEYWHQEHYSRSVNSDKPLMAFAKSHFSQAESFIQT